MKHFQKPFKNILLFIFVLLIIISEIEGDNSAIWYLCILPLICLGAIYLILKNKNNPLEKIISFFIFPIFVSMLLQSLFYFIIEDSNTTYILLALLFIPLSNFGYVIFLIKKRRVSYKELGHMVTAIQSLLFVSTIIGFIAKNPLLFEGILVKTKMGSIGFRYTSIASLSISQTIETLTQTIFLPYLTSTSMIKGWVEYNNFINEQEKI